MAVVVDGTRVELTPPDLDGDGKIGGKEYLSADSGQRNIIQGTELGESLSELNKDTIDPASRQSQIDMRTRLHYLEISSVLALDSLVGLGVVDGNFLRFTMQKKRLQVSLNGEGRKEMVNLVSGKSEDDARKTGFMNKLGGFFGQKKE